MIRKITPSDREFFIRMSKEFYSTDAVCHPVPESHFERTFDELMRSDVYTFCLIPEADGERAGYALISRSWSQEAGGMTIWIEEIYITEENRGKGLGTELFEYLFENFPAPRFRLEVEPENEGAVRLYKSLGFDWFPYGQMIRGK